MKKISSLEELRAEQNKLYLKRTLLEAEIKQQFQEIKSDFEPIMAFTKDAKQVLSKQDNGILSKSIGGVAKFVAEKVLLRKSSFLTRLIVPHLVKNTTSNIVENNKSDIINWVSKLFSKIVHKNNKKHTEQSI
jgi:glutathionyl-hydroquinone reductase